MRTLWTVMVFLFSYSIYGIFLTVWTVVLPDIIQFEILGMVSEAGLWLAIGILVGPLEGIMTAIIYFNQRIKKDGLDIEIGLERLNRALL